MKKGRPPWMFRTLLGLTLPPGFVREGVLGDLEEMWQERSAREGPRHANLWYARQAIGTGVRYLPRRFRGDAHGAPESTGGLRMDAWGGGSMEKLMQDVRFAVRGFIKAPGFMLLAVLSLGLGVGANTAIYSMIKSTLWSELAVPEGHEIVRVSEIRNRQSMMSISYPNYVDVVAEADVFDGAFLRRTTTFGLVSDEISQVVYGEIATANYFEVLGIRPELGRFFDSAEHGSPGSPPVAVMSHFLWTSAFGADRGVIGSTIVLNQNPFTVIGVAPESFHGAQPGLAFDLWVPVGPWSTAVDWSQGWDQQRGSRSMVMLARLADGVELEGANVALQTIGERLAEEYPETNADMIPWASVGLTGPIGPDEAAIPNLIGLLALLGSGLVLLVASGNVASLLLARAVARRGEMGVRLAVGASRGRLVRQLLTESVLLAGMGGVAGIGLTALVARVTPRFLPDLQYRLFLDASPDLQVLLFATLVSLGAVLVFGLTPALQASKSGVAGALNGDDHEGGMRFGGSRFLNGIVVGVVALSFVTLFLAGAFGASLSYVRNVDPGFAKEGRVLATVDFGLAGYSAAEAEAIHDELLETVRAIPGVAAAELTGPVPMGDFSTGTGVYATDREYPPGDLGVNTWHTSATAGWLDVAGLGLQSGRWFTSADEAGAPGVVVINEALANIYWQEQDPVGKRIRMSRSPAGASYTVVGVVETAKYLSMVEQPRPAVYFSMPQRPRPVAVLMARASGDAGELITPIREAVRELNPSLTPFDMKTVSQHLENAYWLYRLGAELGLVIGLLSTALAAGGLYGIMAFRVGQRRREMGIRIALGAPGTRVLRHVLVGSLRLVVVGVLIGTAIAVSASGVVQNVVFGIEADSVLRLLAVGAGLTALALAATVAPAMRAMKVDPVQAIRTE